MACRGGIVRRRQAMRRRFTAREDEILIRLAKDKGDKTWEEIAKHIPGRSACQCRDRYNQYLYTKVEIKPWTKEEDNIIIAKYREIGPHWVAIAQFLSGRSGTNIKNTVMFHRRGGTFHTRNQNLLIQINRMQMFHHQKFPTSRAMIVFSICLTAAIFLNSIYITSFFIILLLINIFVCFLNFDVEV